MYFHSPGGKFAGFVFDGRRSGPGEGRQPELGGGVGSQVLGLRFVVCRAKSTASPLRRTFYGDDDETETAGGFTFHLGRAALIDGGGLGPHWGGNVSVKTKLSISVRWVRMRIAVKYLERKDFCKLEQFTFQSSTALCEHFQ